MAKATSKAGFENALDRLEKIVDEMQSDDLSLDKRLKSFSEGVTLVQQCHKQLEGATKQVEVLVKSVGGKQELKLFDEVRNRLRETVSGDYTAGDDE